VADKQSRKSLRKLTAPYCCRDGAKFRLKDVDPGDTGDLEDESKGEAQRLLAAGVERLARLQDKLSAQAQWSLLLIFQAMDAAGIRPAINAGISVSRVGGAAQTKIMKRKDTGGGVRLALAQYRELAAFAQFASDLDDATRRQLDRGRLVTELMKQPQYQPLAVWEMAVTLFAVNNGYFDGLEIAKALSADKSLRDHLKSKYAAQVKTIEDKKDLTADEEKALKAAIEDWKKTGSF